MVLALVTAALLAVPAAAAAPARISNFSITFRTTASVPVVGEPIRYFSSAMQVNDARLALTGSAVQWTDETGTTLNKTDLDTGLYFEAGPTVPPLL